MCKWPAPIRTSTRPPPCTIIFTRKIIQYLIEYTVEYGNQEPRKVLDTRKAKRQQYSAEFKLKGVLERLQRDTTQEEVCRKFGISSSMLHRWRHAFQEQAAAIFLDQRDPQRKAQSQGYAPGESPDDLKKLIGELTVQKELLNKAQGLLGR